MALEKILCRGTVPDTGKKCNEVVFHTDGGHFVIVAPPSRVLRLEANPIRIRCRRCGYKTKLDFRERSRS
jgi:hypothetical protein